jgi:plasmid maintenance system antidote protein VapI
MRSEDVILHEIQTFIERLGMSETRFGRLSVGDPTVIKRLRNRKSITLETADRIRDFMRQHEQQREVA